MLVQPQQAATVCELDLVLHTIGLSKRAQTLDPNQRPENSHEPLNLTLDLEYAHVSCHFSGRELATGVDSEPTFMTPPAEVSGTGKRTFARDFCIASFQGSRDDPKPS